MNRARLSFGYLPERAAGLAEKNIVEAGPGQAESLELDAGAVEDAQEAWHRRLAAVDVEAKLAALNAGLADEGLAAKEFEGLVASAVDADRDDVAGDAALQLIGRAFGDDLAVV